MSEDNGVIVIKASGRLFGNVAGALGTMVSYFFKLQNFNYNFSLAKKPMITSVQVNLMIQSRQ